jgi:hypothetical protein
VFSHHAFGPHAIALFDRLVDDLMLGIAETQAKDTLFPWLRRAGDLPVKHHRSCSKHWQMADLVAGKPDIVVAAGVQDRCMERLIGRLHLAGCRGVQATQVNQIIDRFNRLRHGGQMTSTVWRLRHQARGQAFEMAAHLDGLHDVGDAWADSLVPAPFTPLNDAFPLEQPQGKPYRRA